MIGAWSEIKVRPIGDTPIELLNDHLTNKSRIAHIKKTSGDENTYERDDDGNYTVVLVNAYDLEFRFATYIIEHNGFQIVSQQLFACEV